MKALLSPPLTLNFFENAEGRSYRPGPGVVLVDLNGSFFSPIPYVISYKYNFIIYFKS